MEQHYKILAETFVECGVAVPNPEYDSSIPFDPASKSALLQLSCQPILITKPERIVSFDETRLTLSQTEPTKSNGERIVKAPKDDGQVLAHKHGSDDATGVGW